MSNGLKISIITACYNAEKTIEQTIQSVLSQTYDNIEYIIVDGASTDRTMDIVRKYADQIDIILSEPDKGVYDAFNKGAKVATGEYIQYMNADDYFISEDIIAEIGSFIEQSDHPAMVYGGVLVLNEDTGYKAVMNEKVSLEKVQEGIMIPHQSTFICKKILEEVGYFDLKYSIAADNDVLCKVYENHKDSILYYPKIISYFRMGGISSDLKNIEKLYKEKKDILDKHFLDNNYQSKFLSNERLLKKWIEKSLFEKKSISDILTDENVKKVVLWGTGELSVMIYKELIDHNIEVLFYVDNNKEKQGLSMNDILINSPEYLKESFKQVDCVIMSFEGRHEQSVIEQLKSYNISSELLVYSWRDLVLQL